MATRNEIEFGSEFLDQIIEWIASHYNPDDVFGQLALEGWAEKWAKRQGEWIPDPDEWAVENGYTKE